MYGNAKKIIIAALCVIAGYLGSQLPKNLTITKTRSVGALCFLEHQAEYPANWIKAGISGAMVHLDLPKYKCDPCSIVKKVGCKSGDRLEEKGRIV